MTLNLWPEEALEGVHVTSLAPLERVGVRVESAAALELLLAAGCTLGPDRHISMPAPVVERAIAVHRATMRDQIAPTRIMRYLVNQHCVTSLVQPSDVPGPLEPLCSYLVLANETDRVFGVDVEKNAFSTPSARTVRASSPLPACPTCRFSA